MNPSSQLVISLSQPFSLVSTNFIFLWLIIDSNPPSLNITKKYLLMELLAWWYLEISLLEPNNKVFCCSQLAKVAMQPYRRKKGFQAIEYRHRNWGIRIKLVECVYVWVGKYCINYQKGISCKYKAVFFYEEKKLSQKKHVF